MNYSDLVKKVAVKSGARISDVKTQLDSLCEVISSTLSSGDEVVLKHVGKLKVKEKPSRMGYNPQLEKKVEYPAKRVVVFKGSSELDNIINK